MSQTVNRYFQRLIGENRGEVLVFDRVEEDDGDIFIVFKNDTRINENLVAPINDKNIVGKIMAEVENPNNIWKFKDRWVGREEEKWEQNAAGEQVCVQPFVEGRKVVDIIPPKPSISKFGDLKRSNNQVNENIVTNESLKINEQPLSKVNQNDPVYITLSKAKKIETEISMDLSVSLPSKDLYKLLKENFEDGNTKCLEYIIENIDVKDIKESLKNALQIMYEENNVNNESSI